MSAYYGANIIQQEFSFVNGSLFIKQEHFYLAWNSQFSSFIHSNISKKIVGALGSTTKKINMFSWSSKQCLVGIQALVSQSMYIIFRCEIHRCDIFGCKGHIFWQVVIIFILFSVFQNGMKVSHCLV